MDSFPLLATALAPRKGLWCPRLLESTNNLPKGLAQTPKNSAQCNTDEGIRRLADVARGLGGPLVPQVRLVPQFWKVEDNGQVRPGAAGPRERTSSAILMKHDLWPATSPSTMTDSFLRSPWSGSPRTPTAHRPAGRKDLAIPICGRADLSAYGIAVIGNS